MLVDLDVGRLGLRGLLEQGDRLGELALVIERPAERIGDRRIVRREPVRLADQALGLGRVLAAGSAAHSRDS